MKCEEFRSRLVADPDVKDLELARHMRECSACQNFADEEARFNRQVAAAAAIDVPTGLAARLKQIATDGSIGSDQFGEISETARQGNTLSKRRHWFIPYAMAAGLAFAAGFGGLLAYHMISLQYADGLQTMVVNHINAERDHLEAHDDVETGEVKALLARFGAELRGEVGEVSYAGMCEINNREGMHMVLEGRQGPVTVLYIADKALEKPVNIDDPRFTGLVIPLEHGNLAVVGERGEAVEQIVETLQDNVVWRM